MPLLPQTREMDDIAAIEDLLDRCVAEVSDLVESACEHMDRLRAYKTKLSRIRSGFDQVREPWETPAEMPLVSNTEAGSSL